MRQNGLRIDGHVPLHMIGSYGSSGSSGIGFSGVYRQPSGTTMRVASRREDGHTFHEKRTPSVASASWKSVMVASHDRSLRCEDNFLFSHVARCNERDATTFACSATYPADLHQHMIPNRRTGEP